MKALCKSNMNEQCIKDLMIKGDDVVKRICAWCDKVMQDGLEPATHVICSECGKKVMHSYEKTSKASS